ncbi:unnamed protein product, partial [Arabidopsis halleri]
ILPRTISISFSLNSDFFILPRTLITISQTHPFISNPTSYQLPPPSLQFDFISLAHLSHKHSLFRISSLFSITCFFRFQHHPSSSSPQILVSPVSSLPLLKNNSLQLRIGYPRPILDQRKVHSTNAGNTRPTSGLLASLPLRVHHQIDFTLLSHS